MNYAGKTIDNWLADLHRKMKPRHVLFILGNFALLNCNPNSPFEGKSASPALVRDAPFINVTLNIKSYSFDSILADLKLTNNGSNDFSFYKPLLPYKGFTENSFGIFERGNYEPVKFLGHSREKHLMVDDGPTNFILPAFVSNSFVILKPSESIEIETNLASAYDFNEFEKKGLNQFKIIYWEFFPLIENGKQVMETDSIDKAEKPVYYSVTVKQNKNPDSMRVPFTVPFK